MRNLILTLIFLPLIFITGCDQQGPLEADRSFLASDEARPADKSMQQIIASGPVVEVPAGSVDALADAIVEAGEGGVVLLKSGQHHESGTVEINHKVSVVGEAGAQLISETVTLGTMGVTDPAIFIHNAAHVVIRGIEFLPKGEVGGTAIFTEHAPNAVVSHNVIREYEYAIQIHQGDRSYIANNTVVGSSAWLTGALPDVEGIIVINGDFVEITNNTVSNTLIGIFASDRKGLMTNNETFGNFIGVILCNVPPIVPTPSGEIVGSETNGTKWIVRGNRAHDNFDIGYLVIDGANQNLLVNNQASNNGRYDIELAGDSERFGFPTPASRETKVVAGKYAGLVVKDCSADNDIVGDVTLVDTVADPCN